MFSIYPEFPIYKMTAVIQILCYLMSGRAFITFDQTIDALLVALSNDNTNDSINFGLNPSDLVGNVSNIGAQINLTSASGGLVLFENINSLTVSHTNNNNINDGFDLAFHAIAEVPEPSILALLGLGLAGLAGLGFARRRKQKA